MYYVVYRSDIIINLLILISLIGGFSVLIRLMTELRNELRKMNELLGYYEVADEHSSDEIETDSKEDIEYELAMNERQVAFDERIEKIKSELSHQSPPQKPRSSVAEVLHPNVENLPHDSVIAYETNLPDEYAE